MRFRSSEVKFVDVTDSALTLDPFAQEGVETFASKMNGAEFISNADFDSEF